MIEHIAIAALEFIGLETAKLALGDIFAVLVVSGFAWVIISAVIGNVAMPVLSNWFDEKKVDKALAAMVVLLGIATFYGGFYLYSVGF